MDLRILTAHVHNSVRCFILGLPVLLLVCASSGAQAFPLSRFTEHLSGLGINVFGEDDNLPEHISVNIPGYFGKAETSGNSGVVLPLGMGGASAEAVVDAVAGGIASARVTHYFGVVGPVIPAPIPLLIDAVLLVEVEQGAIVTEDIATFSVFAPGVIDRTVSLNGCIPLPPPAPPGTVVCDDRRTDWVFNLGMPVGLEGAIGVSALVGGASGRIRALADPYIHIDPSFPLADQYQVVVSSNISNTPPVPRAVSVSSTGSLLIAGLMALALCLSRKNQREAASSNVSRDGHLGQGCGSRQKVE